MRLAIISTHPIQYNAPFFKALNEEDDILVKVFYTWGQSSQGVYDPGFRRFRQWDIPLLEGYEYEFVKNISWSPGSDHFFGVINPGLIKKIKAWKPDLLLVYGWSFFSHLRIIKHFYKKVPLFFRGDSTLINKNAGIKSLLRTRVLTWVYRSVDIALYVGKSNQEYFRKHGVPENKLKYVPHVVDNDRIINSGLINPDEHLRTIKQKIGSKRVFLFVGKIEPVKDPFLLLEAYIAMATPQTMLIFIGEGGLEKQLKEQAVGRGDILFLPFVNQQNIGQAYLLGDVIVLPSISETWGLAINEGMACGLVPVVSNKVGCASDLVDDGVNGFQFQSGNKEELKRKLSELISNDKLMMFKKNAKAKIEDFTISSNVKKMKAIMKEYFNPGKNQEHAV